MIDEAMAYQKPPELYDGLRLHQNENTGGCSPRVLEALARLRAGSDRLLPAVRRSHRRACASYLGVAPDRVTLVNGLDEGIMALAVGVPAAAGRRPDARKRSFRSRRSRSSASTRRSPAARLVQVMPRPDFAFPLDEVLAAITPNTRVVFLTNPNNPTGVSMPLEAIRTIARRVPAGGDRVRRRGVRRVRRRQLHPRARRRSRTSSSAGRSRRRSAWPACGSAASSAHPDTLDPIRRAMPVYSVNIAAVVAVQAALDDLDYLNGYLRQVGRVEGAALRRLRSARADVLEERCQLRARARRRSHRRARRRARSRAASTCAIARPSRAAPAASASATGIVEHTRRCIAVMEEVLCAAR